MKNIKIINKKSIGIFDSGIGGLTVVKEIMNLLPNENIVYLGDTARVPYGTKSKETIIKYSLENTKFLLNHNVKMIVVACNSASSYSIEPLKKILKKIPVIGVIEPGAKTVCEKTKTNIIGVIGTTATIKSNSYKKTILKYSKSKKVKIYSVACPLFVPLIEEGWMDKIYQEKYYQKLRLKRVDYENYYNRIINHEKILKYVASEYLSVLKQKNIDSLVLGCTHYPAIKKVLQDVVGKKVVLIDSAKETAKKVYEILKLKNWLNDSFKSGSIEYYVTDYPDKFKLVGSWLLQKNIKNVKKISL